VGRLPTTELHGESDDRAVITASHADASLSQIFLETTGQP